MAEAAQAVVTSRRVPDALERSSTAVVRMLDATVGVAFLPDPAEIARRRTIGLGALPQMDLLDTLMGLPAGLPVSVHDLTERERRLFRRVPAGVIDVADGLYTRRAVPPVTAQFVVVATRTWKDGLRSAGKFAPFCSRAVLLRSIPEDLDDARMQASFFGVGMCVFASGELKMLTDPQPYVRQRQSCGQWWFAEELYEKVNEFGLDV
ncbi:hypothetical protein B0T44_18790 [Nocardia donostiensis]|uniref:Uncharacterized protein n=2 Tax=Nocardia donostiensis TaxID=1538463 RepID=A0A1W0B845_9NOCA|nr:hypothetical protein B0T46_23630 [Nocardia donostiensis]OQS13352.1 hypothetical protein B0T36_19750 [Nocardia donostiensis]OQS18548.1 hypothetical protein B0T44_18790 [Nocardia donostiensis]